MTEYRVTARRWAKGWELHIHDTQGVEIGVTQARTLAGADRMVRDYLELDERGTAESFAIEVRPELDEQLTAEVRAARRAVRDLERAQREAAAQSRAAARRLKEAGLVGADIAAVLEVSPQRVSQLVNS